MQKLFRISQSEPKTNAILQARAGLGELGVSIADLNRKIERLERITEKWREREPLERAIREK